MKCVRWISLLLLAILIGCSQGEDQEEQNKKEVNEEQATEDNQSIGDDPATDELVNMAETFIKQLSEGNYEEATVNFDATMTEQLSPEGLEEIWDTLQSQLGGYIDHEYKAVEEVDGYRMVLLTGIFNDADVTFRVTFDKEQKIAGFFVQ